jgi:CheY-like chemotaxis protein
MADVPSNAGPLVMVVDDDEDIRTTVSEILEREGYRVVGFGDGRAAMTYLPGRKPPGLILLDLMMPDMNGWQFRAEQVLNPALAAIPVVVITASGPTEDSIDLGVSVLAKPFESDALLAVVRRHLRPGGSQNH